MGKPFDWTILGGKKIEEAIKKRGDKLILAATAALMQEAYAVDAASVKNTPVDTGRLRATHYVAPPAITAERVVCEVGNATDYAVYVHERTEVPHVVGGAKFLERAMNERETGMLQRMAERTKQNLELGRFVIPRLSGVPSSPQDPGAAPSKAHRLTRQRDGSMGWAAKKAKAKTARTRRARRVAGRRG